MPTAEHSKIQWTNFAFTEIRCKSVLSQGTVGVINSKLGTAKCQPAQIRAIDHFNGRLSLVSHLATVRPIHFTISPSAVRGLNSDSRIDSLQGRIALGHDSWSHRQQLR
jgi:hypothetical protein